MAITVLVHVVGEETFVAEIEEMPDPASAFLTFTNPRGRDGKPLRNIEREATRVLYPWHRVNFLETMPSEEDEVHVESFFRD